MSIVILCVCAVITLMLPILAVPLNFFGLIFAKGKIKKWFGFLLALCFAVIAYIWVPNMEADLFRHQADVATMVDYNYSQLSVFIGKALDPVHYLIEFFVAQTNDFSLLQFVVVLCGYFEIFWLICDLSEKKQLGRLNTVLLTLYALAGFKFIDFASGLWFYFASINMVMGVYLKYFRNVKRLHYLFYALAACLHIGTLYFLLIMFLLERVKLFKNLRVSTMIVLFLLVFSSGAIISMLANAFGSDSVLGEIINDMYNGYFVNGEQYAALHTGWVKISAILKSVLCLVLALRYSKKDDFSRYNSFAAYCALCVIALVLVADIFVRYGFFMSMITLPIIIEFLQNEKTKELRILVTAVIIVLVGVNLSYSFTQFVQSGLYRETVDNVTKSIPCMMNGICLLDG